MRSWIHYSILLSAFCVSAATVAAPFEKGDPAKGKTLTDKHCVACHVSLFQGDGSAVYTRPDHKVRNPTQLAARISACNANTGAGWFPEDELDVAAYLNKRFYQFK